MTSKATLNLLTVAALALSLCAACTSGPQAAPVGSTTYSTYTPTVSPGDLLSSAAPEARSGSSVEPSGMTTSPGAPRSTGTSPGDAGTAPATSGTATPGASTGKPRTTIWPAQPTVTLAPSLVVTMSVAPGVDTTGVDIEGAKKAYRVVMQLADEALSQPTENWAPRYADIAIDPALTKLTSEVALMAGHGVRTRGHSKYIATVQASKPDEVLLRVCVDSSGVDVVDTNERSVKSGTPTNHLQNARLVRIANGKWVIAEIAVDSKKTC